MHVHEVLSNKNQNDGYSVISKQCSDFILESGGLPLTKNLSNKYSSLQKVKVRKRKHIDHFGEAFNEAFEQEHFGLRQRAIFANSEPTQPELLTESFYVFPINGYKFMYSSEVEQSDHEYKQVFETMFNQFGDEKSTEILSDLLRFTYSSVSLVEGIQSGAEIILYGIPYYYAVRCAAQPSYHDLLSSITD